MLSPETVLQGRYRIVRQLGQGGMGAVYEAVDERLDTVVALKETLFTEEKLRKQFEREARLLARMHHQALPRVSDHFNEGDGQFLVMQYIAGEDFYEMLTRRNSPFPQEEVLRWGDQLCDALDYLHTQDPPIIHRDIKPQNLKLTARGQVVLLDFGLAKGSGGQMSVVTTSASIFGYTPNYAPLEQVQGLGTDARSDIYSLSATLYHLLTNIKPPDALSRAAAMVNGQPDPLIPANQVSGVSSAVAATLNKAMAQKRDDRYASALLMRDALRVAAEHPLGAAPTVVNSGAAFAAAPTVSKDQKTNLGAAQTQAMASEAQTLIGADVTDVRPAVISGEAATVVRPAPPAKRSRALPAAAAALIVLIVGSVGAFYLYRARRNASQPNTVAGPSEAQPQKQSSITPDTSSPNGTANAETRTDKTKSETAVQRSAATKPSSEKSVEPGKTNSTQSAPDETAHESNRDQNRRNNPNMGPPPQPSPPFPNRNPADRGPGHPPAANQPGVRTLPNGVTIETKPDGTRIVTMRNGTTRVIPPDERPNRRKPQP